MAAATLGIERQFPQQYLKVSFKLLDTKAWVCSLIYGPSYCTLNWMILQCNTMLIYSESPSDVIPSNMCITAEPLTWEQAPLGSVRLIYKIHMYRFVLFALFWCHGSVSNTTKILGLYHLNEEVVKGNQENQLDHAVKDPTPLGASQSRKQQKGAGGLHKTA